MMGASCPFCNQPGDGSICMDCADKYEKDADKRKDNLMCLESSQANPDHSDCPICNPTRIICRICGEKFVPDLDENICGDCWEAEMA